MYWLKRQTVSFEHMLFANCHRPEEMFTENFLRVSYGEQAEFTRHFPWRRVGFDPTSQIILPVMGRLVARPLPSLNNITCRMLR